MELVLDPIPFSPGEIIPNIDVSSRESIISLLATRGRNSMFDLCSNIYCSAFAFRVGAKLQDVYRSKLSVLFKVIANTSRRHCLWLGTLAFGLGEDVRIFVSLLLE